MTAADLQKIGRELASALPGERWSAQPQELAPYQVSNPLAGPTSAPALVARPRNGAELQKLIGLANQQGWHLVPVSSAPPHGRGSIACAKEHLIVDLSSWKECKHIDRRNRVCLIEPGVTYPELLAALRPFGMTVPMPLAPRSTKSVAAAVMDREPSTWPNKQWDISDPVACTELIFGTGDLFRTGAAGGPGTLEQQRAAGGAQKSPMGPSQTEFQRVVQGAQGCLGIFTWITVRTELLPTLEEPQLIGADALDKIIPLVYEVQRPSLGEHCLILDRSAAAMLMTYPDPKAFEAARSSWPPFICLVNIAGFERLPEQRVHYQLQDITEIASRHGLHLASALGSLSARALLARATSPGAGQNWRHALRGHCLSIFFLTTLDRAPSFLELAKKAARGHRLDPDGLGTYLQPVVQNHACHMELMFPYDPLDQTEVDRLRRFEEAVVRELLDAGAFFSRPYGVAERMAFSENPLNLEVLRKIKKIFDPNRVLHPGKFGL